VSERPSVRVAEGVLRREHPEAKWMRSNRCDMGAAANPNRAARQPNVAAHPRFPASPLRTIGRSSGHAECGVILSI